MNHLSSILMKLTLMKLWINSIYKNHGIHRAKAYLKAVFQSKIIQKEIDDAFLKFGKDEDGKIIMEILQITEVIYVISYAMIFDAISTLGYKIDLVYRKEFENLATGDYKFVLDQCGVFFNILFNNIYVSEESHRNSQKKGRVAVLDTKQVSKMPLHDTIITIPFLEALRTDEILDSNTQIKLISAHGKAQIYYFCYRKIIRDHIYRAS